MRPSIWISLIATGVLAGCAANSGPSLTERQDTVTTGALGTASVGGSVGAGPTTAAPQRQSAVVKIGLMLPLSGPGQAAVIAGTMKKAAELSLTDARAPHVSLSVRDDKGTPEGATAAANELVREGVEVVLGPLFSTSVKAAQPIARQANLQMLAFSNDRQVAGGSVTLLSFLVEPEVNRVIAHAAQTGKKRLAALLPDDTYGRLTDAALTAAASQHGVTVVARQTYPVDNANGAAQAVQTLRDTMRGIEEHGDPLTGLFLAGGEDSLVLVTPALRQAQIDTKRLQILGTGALDYSTAGREPLLVGAWFAAPDPKGWADFATRFANTHGHSPPRIAALAYDAMTVGVALSNGPDGARFNPTTLTRATGFEGIDGPFRLRADGTMERPLAILEVQPTGARVIDAAPRIVSGNVPASVPGVTPSGAATAAQSAAQSGVLSAIPSAFPPVN